MIGNCCLCEKRSPQLSEIPHSNQWYVRICINYLADHLEGILGAMMRDAAWVTALA